MPFIPAPPGAKFNKDPGFDILTTVGQGLQQFLAEKRRRLEADRAAGLAQQNTDISRTNAATAAEGVALQGDLLKHKLEEDTYAKAVAQANFAAQAAQGQFFFDPVTGEDIKDPAATFKFFEQMRKGEPITYTITDADGNEQSAGASMRSSADILRRNEAALVGMSPEAQADLNGKILRAEELFKTNQATAAASSANVAVKTEASTIAATNESNVVKAQTAREIMDLTIASGRLEVLSKRSAVLKETSRALGIIGQVDQFMEDGDLSKITFTPESPAQQEIDKLVELAGVTPEAARAFFLRTLITDPENLATLKPDIQAAQLEQLRAQNRLLASKSAYYAAGKNRRGGTVGTAQVEGIVKRIDDNVYAGDSSGILTMHAINLDGNKIILTSEDRATLATGTDANSMAEAFLTIAKRHSIPLTEAQLKKGAKIVEILKDVTLEGFPIGVDKDSGDQMYAKDAGMASRLPQLVAGAQALAAAGRDLETLVASDPERAFRIAQDMPFLRINSSINWNELGKSLGMSIDVNEDPLQRDLRIMQENLLRLERLQSLPVPTDDDEEDVPFTSPNF